MSELRVLEETAANGAPAGEPEVWDERVREFNPLNGRVPEEPAVHVSPGFAESRFDVSEYLREEQTKDLLRFSTAGSVDDGKSTLIGRLLYDTQSVYEDQVRSIEGKGTTAPGVLDLALLTDGLRAEREQGITIDVAYRYFSTGRRKFIIADTPGHEQYTRNMATGASTAQLAIVLVDARKGVLVQSRRHACIAALLGVGQIVVAVNKMDLVGYAEDSFRAVEQEFTQFLTEAAERTGARLPRLEFVPVSALTGENVVHRATTMPWYGGAALLEMLEETPAEGGAEDAGFRMAVQRVVRPHLDFRGFAGQIAAGAVRRGDRVRVSPAGRESRVRAILTFDGELEEASAPQSVVLTLEDELDISRGDVLTGVEREPAVAKRLAAQMVWMDAAPLALGRRYLLKHMSRTVQARVTAIQHRLDVATLSEQAADTLGLNEIGLVELETTQPLVVDAYAENRTTGSFVLIDPVSNATVGAGMIREVLASTGAREQAVTTDERAARWGHRGAVLEVRGARQTADALERALFERGAHVLRLEDARVARAAADAGALVLVFVQDGGEDRAVVNGLELPFVTVTDLLHALEEQGVLRREGVR